MPVLARAVYGSLSQRPGLLLTMMAAIAAPDPDLEEAMGEAPGRLLGTGMPDLVAQMEAGRLRPMHPLLAMPSLAGPIFFHGITRPLADRLLHLEVSPEDAVTQLVQAWLRAMRPDVSVGARLASPSPEV